MAMTLALAIFLVAITCAHRESGKDTFVGITLVATKHPTTGNDFFARADICMQSRFLGRHFSNAKDAAPGSFGSCAVVGNGGSSTVEYGAAIDLHDTVIRSSTGPST